MNTDLRKNGWVLSSHCLSTETLNTLIKKKSEFLKVSCEEVEEAFNVHFSEFEKEKIEYIELAKGITRAFLRYDSCSHLLAQAIWKELRENPELSSQIKYIALPYPIIHFPFDTSETASKHKDAYDYINHFYTTWTPLNDCLHQPLVITERTHQKQFFFLRQLRIRLKFIDRLINASKKNIKPDVMLGEFLTWHGKTEHEGLLNTTNKPHVALAIRFTSSPIMSESTLSVEEIENYVPVEIGVFSRSLVKKIIQTFEEIRHRIAHEGCGEARDLNKTVAEIRAHIKTWDFSKEELKRLSYIFGLWAQRMESKGDVSVFYLYSFFCGADNYFFLRKCIRHAIAQFNSNESENLINSILRDFPNEQVAYVIRDSIKISGELGEKIKVQYPKGLELLKSSLG